MFYLKKKNALHFSEIYFKKHHKLESSHHIHVANFSQGKKNLLGILYR